MGYKAYRRSRATDLSTRAAGDNVHFRCDTEADLPSANVQDEDSAYTLDTKKFWDRVGGAWESNGEATGATGGPHDHDIDEVTGLEAALAGKAATGHGHAISDVTNLQTTLDGKAAAAVVTDHVALADPHAQYQKESEKAAANGYASLDAGTKVPTAQVPVAAMTMCVPLWPGTNTLTNMALADTEQPATHWRHKLDLTGFTQFRVTARVATQGTAGSDLRVQYSTDDSSFANLDGVNGPEIGINSTGQKDTGWVNLAAGAIGADRFIRVMGKDGDGAADPVVRQLTLWLR